MRTESTPWRLAAWIVASTLGCGVPGCYSSLQGDDDTAPTPTSLEDVVIEVVRPGPGVAECEPRLWRDEAAFVDLPGERAARHNSGAQFPIQRYNHDRDWNRAFEQATDWDGSTVADWSPMDIPAGSRLSSNPYARSGLLRLIDPDDGSWASTSPRDTYFFRTSRVVDGEFEVALSRLHYEAPRGVSAALEGYELVDRHAAVVSRRHTWTPSSEPGDYEFRRFIRASDGSYVADGMARSELPGQFCPEVERSGDSTWTRYCSYASTDRRHVLHWERFHDDGSVVRDEFLVLEGYLATDQNGYPADPARVVGLGPGRGALALFRARRGERQWFVAARFDVGGDGQLRDTVELAEIRDGEPARGGARISDAGDAVLWTLARDYRAVSGGYLSDRRVGVYYYGYGPGEEWHFSVPVPAPEEHVPPPGAVGGTAIDAEHIMVMGLGWGFSACRSR